MAYCKPQSNLELWSSLPAISLVAIFVVFSIPVRFPKSVSKLAARILAPFQPTLTLAEAKELEFQFLQEGFNSDEGPWPEHCTSVNLHENAHVAPKWRTALFVGLALMGVTAKVVEGVLILMEHSNGHGQLFGMLEFLIAITWVYVLVRVLHIPPVTPPYDVFLLSILNLLRIVLTLGEQLYTSQALGTPWPSIGCLTTESIDLGITITLLALIMSLPLNIPSADIDPATIGTVLSPEDYTSLANWITFSWVQPLVDVGSRKTLNDEDVWDISPTLKTGPTFVSYNQMHGSNVLWKLLRANSMDLIIDCFFSVVGVFLDFAQPYFLRLILVGLETTPSGSRFPLYLYATLAFVANILKAQLELQHLWYARRATSRIGTQISAAIYDKALRMKDHSGLISAIPPVKNTTLGNKIARESGKDGKEQELSKEERKNTDGTDVGKIVNHMAIDCQTLMKQVLALPTICNAPVQLILSCVYLYSILGISALAGFISLAFALPLSRWLTKLTVRITHETLSAKDSRMKLVNEMFGAIKFIKLFGWERQWIKRVIAARDVEIKWLKNARNVNVVYSLVWMVVPTMGSILTFLTYVSAGNDLNVSTAFTAIRLFDMLKKPLGALPFALITLAQTRVSLERLKTFFNEEEVPDDVSSLARPPASEPQELKLENATFTWTTGRKLQRTEDNNLDNPSQIAEIARLTTPRTDDGEEYIATPPSSIGIFPAEDKNSPFELRNISIHFEPGKLTVVTGPTASGKTALLLALLGEMDKLSGTASRPKNPTIVDEYGLMNSISYAAQTPWLQQQSIKGNIVFGYPMDDARYDAAVEACALDPDFDTLEDGDLTEIGSKGVSLSGGQRARVALARAVYAPTQYILLDDIFSAVDSHTARFLFDRLLCGPLLAHRTVILVTHHVELVLPGTHYVVQMSEGRVEYQGTVKELKQKGVLDHLINASSLEPEKSNLQSTESRENPAIYERGHTPMTESKMARKLVEEEARAVGVVRWSVYNTYLKTSSYWTWVCVLFGIAAAETLNVGIRLWVSIWGNAYNVSTDLFALIRSTGNFLAQPKPEGWDILNTAAMHNLTMARFVSPRLPDARVHPLFYVAVYCGIGVAAAIVATLTQWILFTGGIRGGRVLFRSLLMSLSVATFRFYDTTPTGRILNRFGKDFDTLDTLLPFMLYNTATYIAAFLAAVTTVVAVVPWFLPVGAVLAYCYTRLSVGYLATGRDLRRMESTSRSPILAGFSDLIEGIITVRAFSSERRFLEDHYKRVDTTNRFWYFTWMLNRWLLVRFDALGAASVYACTLFVLSGYISAGLAGLSMVSAMTFTSSVYWTCRGYTDVELSLNSVERIVEYLDIPKEPPAIIESNRVPAYWPSSSGSDALLVVEDLEVKYAPELPSVLHGVSFSLKARERVGILGRTGCGKSTLAMSLLRFVEPFRGKVLIDGIDITTIGTHDLRSRITFIAQDQALFLGTVRENLDPFNEHADAECLDALSRVHLTTQSASNSQKDSRAPSRASSVHAMPEGSSVPSILDSEVATQVEGGSTVIITLDTKVSAGGQNFSNGQRQLLAMARALLRQSGIIILDEATSSIDKATDVKIQAAIREEFHSSLLLTIAHRLETIVDFDRLIVLENGRIAEFDTPLNLIQKEHGVFRDMCIQSGSFKELEMAIKSNNN